MIARSYKKIVVAPRGEAFLALHPVVEIRTLLRVESSGMLRRTFRRLCIRGEPERATGGIPFYGNLYQGRVNPEDYQPSQYSTNEEARTAMLTYQRVYADDDPYIRAKLDKCPYFALCDLCVWHGMAPTFLDPGLLTTEEHHLLLLYSRGYYEKWSEIHSKPREVAPKPRIKKGRFDLSRRLFQHARCSEAQIRKAQDLLIDDASFFGMNPKLWRHAHLDEKVRDHLTGRVLEFAGLTESQMADIFATLERMRSIVVRRRDDAPTDHVAIEGAVDSRAVAATVDGDYLTFNYRDVPTLFDLYKSLGLQTYSGQLKCYSFIDRVGTEITMSFSDEDVYFDFLVSNFLRAALEVPEPGSTSPYVITVEAKTRAEATRGKWF